jgi:hypothetical protein
MTYVETVSRELITDGQQLGLTWFRSGRPCLFHDKDCLQPIDCQVGCETKSPFFSTYERWVM